MEATDIASVAWIERREVAGPAGGAYVRAGDGPVLEVDALAFCRALSGRATGDGLPATGVVF